MSLWHKVTWPGVDQSASRVCLLSTQGAVITLPYCYLNSEVQQALLVRWRRWRLVRRVEAEYNMKTVRTEQTNNNSGDRTQV